MANIKSKDLLKTLNKKNFYDHHDAGMTFLLTILIPIAVEFIVLYIGFLIFNLVGIDLGEKWSVEIFNYLSFSVPCVIIMEFVYFFIFLGYNHFRKIEFSACKVKLDKTIDPLTSVLCAVFGIVAVLCSFLLFNNVFGEVFKKLGIEASSNDLPINNFGWFVFHIFFGAVLTGIFEELLFRGIIYHGLKKSYGAKIAIVLSALVFAFAHQDITQFLYALVMGLAFAVVVEKTGNVFYSMLIHVFSNFTSYLMMYLDEVGAINLNIALKPWTIVLAILLFLALVGIFMLLYFFVLKKRNYQKEEEEKQEFKLKTGFPIALVAGFAICLFSIVIKIILVQ